MPSYRSQPSLMPSSPPESRLPTHVQAFPFIRTVAIVRERETLTEDPVTGRHAILHCFLCKRSAMRAARQRGWPPAKLRGCRLVVNTFCVDQTPGNVKSFSLTSRPDLQFCQVAPTHNHKTQHEAMRSHGNRSKWPRSLTQHIHEFFVRRGVRI